MVSRIKNLDASSFCDGHDYRTDTISAIALSTDTHDIHAHAQMNDSMETTTMCTYGYGDVNYCNNENRSKVMCRIISLYQRLGGKVHPRFLPVAIIGISQHGKYGSNGKYWQIFFPTKYWQI